LGTLESGPGSNGSENIEDKCLLRDGIGARGCRLAFLLMDDWLLLPARWREINV